MAKMLDFDAENPENATTIDVEPDDVTGLQDNIDAQLSEVFEQFGGDEQDSQFKINIYRVQEGRGELGYCFSCVPSELPILDKIQENFGAGKYEMRLYEKTDKTRLKKRTKFVIEKAVKKAAPVNPMSEIHTVLAAMAEQQQRSMDQFKEMLLMQRQTAPVAQPQTSITELVTALSGLHNMMPQAPAAGGMEMFMKGVELMKDFAVDAGGGREKGLYDMLIEAAKTFGGPIAEMAKTTTAALPQPGTQQPSGVAIPPGAVMYMPPGQPGQLENAPPMAVQTEQVKQSEADQMGIMLTMQVNNLVNQAAAGKDPALYADLIIDNMSEAQIREFLGRPDLKALLVSINPNVSNYWPWFEKLQSEVMAGLTMPETPADTPIITTDTPEPSTNAIEPNATGDTTENT